MSDNQEMHDYLQNCGIFYLTTVNGDKSACRPVSFHMIVDDKEYFAIGQHKDVYKQMVANPNVQIVGGKGSDWIRIGGKAVFDDDPALFDKAIETMPFLANLYNEKTGNKMGIFSLEDATAEYIEQMMVVVKSVRF